MRERTGSVDFVKGKHRVRITLNTGERKELGRFTTRKEAVSERDEALRVVEKNRKPRSLGTFIDLWLKGRVAAKFRDAAGDRNRFKTHLEGDPIARLDVRSVRRADVVRWVDRMHEKGIARQTIVNAYGVLRRSLLEAMRRGYVRENILLGVQIPRSVRTQDPWTFLEPDEQSALIESFSGPIRFLVAFAIGSGLRAGELCALRLADVDLRTQPGRITVRYGRPHSKPTKNGKIRVVPLVPAARSAIESWLAVLPGYAEENPFGLAFPRPGGGFRDFAHVISYVNWTGALTKSCITRRVRWHDLRHTCASSLVSGWWGRRWSLEEVKEMLGHSSITLTQRYAHLAGSAVEDAARATPFGGAKGSPEPPDPKSPGKHRADFEGRTRDLRFTKPQSSRGKKGLSAENTQLRTLCSEYIDAATAKNADRAERLRRELTRFQFGDHRRTTEFCERVLSSGADAITLATLSERGGK